MRRFAALFVCALLYACPILAQVPVLEVGTESGVDDDWVTVSFDKTYTNPVILCFAELKDDIFYASPRIDNIDTVGKTFDLRLQDELDSDFDVLYGMTVDVHYMIIEAGTWVFPDGTKIEAGTVFTDKVGHGPNDATWWDGNNAEEINYSHTYDEAPIVLHQVMSVNDPTWVTTWSSGIDDVDAAQNRFLLPGLTKCQIGLNMSSATTPTHAAAETIGYVIMEVNKEGFLDGVEYKSARSADIVQGRNDGAGQWEIEYPSPFAVANSISIASQQRMEGPHGSWSVGHGNTPGGTGVEVHCEEVNSSPDNHSHTTEIHACIAFEPSDGSNVWQGDNSDDWNDALNWSLGHVPTNAEKAVIGFSAPLDPIVKTGGADAEAARVVIESQRSLTIESPRKIDIEAEGIFISAGATLVAETGATICNAGPWTNNGTFTPNCSTVIFDGADAQRIIGATTFCDLEIANTSGPSAFDDVDATDVVTVSGLLTVTSGRFSPTEGADFNDVDVRPGAELDISGASTPIGAGDPVFEMGVVTVDENFVEVALTNTYVSPVVVAMNFMSSFNNNMSVRVRSVTSTSFEIAIDKLSGIPFASEEVHYFVIEEGVWSLDRDIKLEAHRFDTATTGVEGAWNADSIAFSHEYGSSPVLLHQVMTENSPRWVTTWASEDGDETMPPTATAAQIGLSKASETTEAPHPVAETIGWVAIEAGIDTLFQGVHFQTVLTGATITNNSSGLSWPSAFASVPEIVIASQQSMIEDDGSWIVGEENVAETVASIRAEESASGDSTHAGEYGAGIGFEDALTTPSLDVDPIAIRGDFNIDGTLLIGLIPLEFTGGATQNVDTAGPPLELPPVIVNKDAGTTVDFNEATNINGDLVINEGVLALNGDTTLVGTSDLLSNGGELVVESTVTLTASDEVSVAGRVLLNDDTSLTLADQVVVDILNGGVLDLLGTDSAAAGTAGTIESTATGVDSWKIMVRDGGTLDARSARFRDGVICSEAEPRRILISDASFDAMPVGLGDAYLDLSGVSTGENALAAIEFENNTAVGAPINIRADGTTKPVYVVGSSGALSGAGFEDDASDVIAWETDTDPIRVYTDNGGPVLADVNTLLEAIDLANADELTIRAHYDNAGQVDAFNTISGVIRVPDFTGILNIEGFEFQSDGGSNTVLIDATAVASGGTLNIYNSFIADVDDASAAGRQLVSEAVAGTTSVIFTSVDTNGFATAGLAASGNAQNSLFVRANDSSYFVDPGAGDFRLSAAGAVNVSTAARDVDYTLDVDGNERSTTTSYGGNEFIGTTGLYMSSGPALESGVISSIAGAPVQVIDFTFVDVVGFDALSSDLDSITVDISGSADASEGSWTLDGPDAVALAGVVAGSVGNQTVTFSGLPISIASGDAETYTLSVEMPASPGTTEDNDTFDISIDGAQVTKDGGGTSEPGMPPVESVATYQVIATQLAFVSQPTSPQVASVPFTGAVEYVDANGNRDLDANDSVFVAFPGTGGVVQPAGGILAAVDGVASFTGGNSLVVLLPAITGGTLIFSDDPGGTVTIATSLTVFPFTLEAPDVVVTSLNPAGNAVSVPTTSTATATFSKDMKVGTSANFVTHASFTGRLSGAYAGGNTDTLSFDGDGTFKAGEEIEVTLTVDLEATDSGNLPTPYVYRFLTATTPSSGEYTQTGSIGEASDEILAVASGDLDGDGDLDLVIGLDGSNKVFLNTGAGIFVEASSFGGNKRTTALALGDVDGDGDLDVAVGNDGSVNEIYANDGNAALLQRSTFGSSSTMTADLEFGDFDGDGDLDLAEGNQATGSGSAANDHVRFNSGSGSFSASSTQVGATAQVTSVVQSGDMDGDGDLDLIAGYLGAQNLIFLNGSAGLFGNGSGFGVAADTTNDIALGDLDGDGDLEAVVANGNAEASYVYENDGSAGMTLGDTLLPGDGSLEGVELADLDGDGDLDILGSGSGDNESYTNDGSGAFTPLPYTENGADSSVISVGDFDGDGDVDLLTDAEGQGQIYLNGDDVSILELDSVSPTANTSFASTNTDVSATFTRNMALADATTFSVHGSTTGATFGNYSGSSTPTLIFTPNQLFMPGALVEATLTIDITDVTDQQIASPYVWRFLTAAGLASAQFDQEATFGSVVAVSTSLAAGDFDADGDLDLLLASGTTTFPLFNDGNGNLVEGEVIANFAADQILVVDLDEDGDLDAVFGRDGQQDEIYVNDGSGLFTLSGLLGGAATATRTLSYGDFNGDGLLDLLVGLDGSVNRVYWNDGALGFASFENVGPGNDVTRGIAVGDVDQDGDLDLFVGNFNQDNVLYYNNGNGAFDTMLTVSVGGATSDVALADLDGDGDLEAIVANDGGANQIYPNNGDGSFALPDGFGSGSDTTLAIQVGDVDGDGDLDLVSIDGDGTNVQLNQGDGEFDDAYLIGTNNDSNDLLLGDFDGDGSLDIVQANDAEDRIFFNPNNNPIVVDVSPAQNSHDALTNDTIVGTFSELMTFLALDTFVTHGSMSGHLNGFFGASGFDLTMAPQLPMKVGEEVEVTFTTGLLSVEDLPLQKPFVFRFSIGPELPGGAFSGSGSGDSLHDTRAAAAGDVDGDGDVDVVLGNFGQQNMIFLNDGKGSFVNVMFFGPGDDDTTALALADLDRDGDLDIVVGNVGQNRVYFNNAGAFVAGGAFGAADSATSAVQAGDLDGDGDLDVAVANDGQNAVYLNDGEGDVSLQHIFGSDSENTADLALGDADNDGDLDILGANMDGANRVYFNDGRANFDSSKVIAGSEGATQAAAFGDLDGDGWNDAVFGYASGNPGTLHINNQSGAFPDVTTFGSATDDVRDLALIDINGDGSLDVVAAVDGKNDYYRNNGLGGLVAASPFGSPVGDSYSIAYGDFDGSGTIDPFITANGENVLFFNRQSIHKSDTVPPFFLGNLRDGFDPANWNVLCSFNRGAHVLPHVLFVLMILLTLSGYARRLQAKDE